VPRFDMNEDLDNYKEYYHKLKDADVIDLLLFMDCTGSMRNYIKKSGETLVEIINLAEQHLVKKNINIRKIRVAFIGYRDEGDKG
jgi:hypothetical protein